MLYTLSRCVGSCRYHATSGAFLFSTTREERPNQGFPSSEGKGMLIFDKLLSFAYPPTRSALCQTVPVRETDKIKPSLGGPIVWASKLSRRKKT